MRTEAVPIREIGEASIAVKDMEVCDTARSGLWLKLAAGACRMLIATRTSEPICRKRRLCIFFAFPLFGNMQRSLKPDEEKSNWKEGRRFCESHCYSQ